MNKKIINAMTGEELETLARAIMAMILLKGEGDIYKLSKKMLEVIKEVGAEEIKANFNFQNSPLGVYSLTLWQFIGSLELDQCLKVNNLSTPVLTLKGEKECEKIVQDSVLESERLSKVIEKIAEIIGLKLESNQKEATICSGSYIRI